MIDQIGCSGCEACIAFCPVDCIEIVPGPDYPELLKLVPDWDVHLLHRPHPWSGYHLLTRPMPNLILHASREPHMSLRQHVTLPRIAQRLRVDLVHYPHFDAPVHLMPVPVVATVHGKNYYADAGRRVLAMRLLPTLGATVVAVSSDIRSYLEGALGVRGVRVIPNGIDVHRYEGGNRAAARRTLGLDPEACIIGAVGNLYRVKGHAVLVEAVARLGDPRLHVVIAGRGEEEAALRRQAASAGMGDRLHLLGFREDVPQLLAAFDFYALPSFSEGQSLALIEAMAAGLPIVASRVGGNPEILTDGEHGLLCGAGDAEALAAALRRLIADPAAAGRLAEAGRARARAEFSLEAMVKRYRRLYAERGLELSR